MRYVKARSEELYRERAYRVYVTDALRACLPGKTGNAVERYADLFKPTDNRTSEEIIDIIRGKLGGM